MVPNDHAHKLRIVDRWGHTLCYFNSKTNTIEIKATTRRGGQQSTKGEIYAISLEHLLSVLQAPEPVFVLIANMMEPPCKSQS